ncbi:MAG: FHA domain-containing protein [Planctomycetota bacterium]|jgi:hypothetical protein
MGTHTQFHTLFGEFTRFFGQLDWERFSALFPCPILEVDLKDIAQASKDTLLHYAKTSTAEDSTSHGEDEEKRMWRNAVIAPLVKSERNNFEGKITLGRAPIHDVVLPHRAVSKLHAFFEADPSNGDLALYDADSSFGTAVDGRSLVSGEPFPLKSGATLVFAKSVQAIYFSPRDFFNYMRLKLRKGKTRKL